MRVWTTTWGRHFIYTRFGTKYRRERVRQVVPALGVRLRRLRHRHLKATPEEQATFRAALEEWLVGWPAAWEWLCVAEASVRRHPPRTAQWRLVDEVPEVPTGDDPAKAHGYGAVAPLTGRTH